jgi:hypothetical protein
MERKDDGTNFQITVDGKTCSYRDTRERALEAGMFLKEGHPQSDVVVRDVRNDAWTVFGWKNGSGFSNDVVPLGQAWLSIVGRNEPGSGCGVREKTTSCIASPLDQGHEL